MASVSVASIVLAVALALVTFNGVRAANGAVALADPFLVLSAVLALLAGGSLIASRTQRRLLAIGYVFVIASLLSAITGAPLETDLTNMSRFLLAAVGLPAVVLMIVRSVVEMRLLAYAFVLSACVASLAAIADSTLGTGIAGAVTTQEATSETRFGGLTSHSNHLGIACAMSLPVAVALVRRGIRWQSLPLLAGIVVLVLGIGIAGSRAGFAAGAAGLALFVVFERRRLPQVAIVFAVTIAAVAFLFAGGSLAVEDFRTPLDRLLDPTSTTASDAAHAGAQEGALAAFSASPVWGSGFQEIRSGLSVPLQIAASAGVMGIAAFLALIGTTVQAGRRALRNTSTESLGTQRALAAAFLASSGAWLVAGLAQNVIFDRYIYVPVGLVLALSALSSPQTAGSGHVTTNVTGRLS